MQKMCRHTHQWCRHNNTDSKAKCVKMLRLCRHESRVCRHELQFFRNQSTQVDTLSEQVDTRPSSQNSQFEELGQQVDTLPEQVDTGPSSQNSIFHILDSVSTPPPGQVDTLREVFILKWMGATCQPRPMGINLGSCALIPKRYLWTLLGIKGPLLALHPRKRDPTKTLRASRKFLVAARGCLPPLLSCASRRPILTNPSASQEFKNLTEKLEIEKQEKQQKIEEIITLKNQLKEREEVIQTFTKGQDNLEALLGSNMTTTSHGLGFNKKKSTKDKSGEKNGKAPLIKFVKGPNLENTEIQQTANETLNKTPNKAKTQKQKKTIRSTQSPDRSTCSTSKITNNSTKNSNKNLKNKTKVKEMIHKKPWTSKTTVQDNWTNPWSQWYENPCWYHPQFYYPNFLMKRGSRMELVKTTCVKIAIPNVSLSRTMGEDSYVL
ncbi:hypothetical protein Taro_024574, partial [Colocasia esculenta]|nr:hypothetical protein [Colocasia esculenta]